jgi:murein DD-endopeptidase MepM/ murein hydrolase activator NlpD
MKKRRRSRSTLFCTTSSNRKYQFLNVLFALVFLAGCQAQKQVRLTPQSTDKPVAAQNGSSSGGSIPLPQVGSVDIALTPPVPAEEPLRFTLPTPGQPPNSLWRPPLYDIPWALGPYDHFFFSRPIAANEVNWPLADYRYGGVFFENYVHTGIDIPNSIGTPVLAAADGKVIWAGYGLFYGNNDPKDPYGLAVTVRHDFGFNGQRLYTVYAHMSEIKVVNGQEVKTGDLLGLVGDTGNTTGPHLHFEVRIERNSYFATLNPELWLAPPQGWGVLVGRVMNTNGSLLYLQDVVIRNKETRQKWTVRSYGNQAVNSDPYYDENLVLSDLPAGQYEIIIDYEEKRYIKDIEIHPGAVSYFTFRGKLWFTTGYPPDPNLKGIVDIQGNDDSTR